MGKLWWTRKRWTQAGCLKKIQAFILHFCRWVCRKGHLSIFQTYACSISVRSYGTKIYVFLRMVEWLSIGHFKENLFSSTRFSAVNLKEYKHSKNAHKGWQSSHWFHSYTILMIIGNVYVKRFWFLDFEVSVWEKFFGFKIYQSLNSALPFPQKLSNNLSKNTQKTSAFTAVNCLQFITVDKHFSRKFTSMPHSNLHKQQQ